MVKSYFLKKKSRKSAVLSHIFYWENGGWIWDHSGPFTWEQLPEKYHTGMAGVFKDKFLGELCLGARGK